MQSRIPDSEVTPVTRRILASVAVILLTSAAPAFARLTTQHHQAYIGSMSSRSASPDCSFTVAASPRGRLDILCSTTAGRAVATYTFRFTGRLMGTPTFSVNAVRSPGVKVTAILSHPLASMIRVTVIARGKGSLNIRSVGIDYSTC